MSAQDNHLKTGDGFFARVSPRLDAIEEVTVNSAAQDASSTGQGAVQIQFVTRSGTNEFRGSGYYYLRHYKLNANTWFNNRDNAPKADDVLHQPGGRIGGPIVIPGLWNGKNKAFFFFNYEESRSPGGNTENRTLLHPRSEQGWFRYTASGQTREVNVLSLAGANGFVSTHRPDDRASARRHPRVDLRQHGRRQHRPADAELHLLVRDRLGDEVPDRTPRSQRHRQAPPVVVDDLHRPRLDAGHDEQPRAELPRLPEHRQPGLGSLHHARHVALDARRQSRQRVHRRRLRRPDDVLAGDRRQPVQRHVGRRSGRVPLEYQRGGRHHQCGVDRLLLGA